MIRIIVAISLAALFAVAPAKAETFEFDLTDVVGTDFNSFPESVVDLDVRFSRIDSARVQIVGEFTPGTMTMVTNPPNAGPILPMENMNLIIRLGEIGTAWLNKPVYALQDLHGHKGTVAFDLPLRGSETANSPVPILLPSGDLPPDYDFLLDGRFGLSASSMQWAASLYDVLESPEFELESFVLQVEGVAVPEPGTWILLFAACSSAVIFRVARRQTRRPSLAASTS